MGKLHFDDLQLAKGYKPFLAYAQTKLAMLVFALELQRRSDAAGWGLLSTAAHPGYARTDLVANGPGRSGMMGLGISLVESVLSQTSAQGALPQLFAATSPLAQPGGYYGPDGPFEMVGKPTMARVPGAARDRAAAARFWAVSEELAGVHFPAVARAA